MLSIDLVSKPSQNIFVAKENQKFSSAHMTIFDDATKESIHGHNYQVRVSVRLNSQQANSKLFPFAKLKSAILKICAEWDEKLLLPQMAKALTIINHDDKEIEFRLCGSRYVIPSKEVVVLSTDNITVENLSLEFLNRLRETLAPELPFIAGIDIELFESPGQGAGCSWNA